MAKSKQPVLLTMEKEAEVRAKGFTAVCGIDEAGRGPLAGPVVAAAVILPEGIELPGVNDSKKITEKKIRGNANPYKLYAWTGRNQDLYSIRQCGKKVDGEGI